MCFKISLIFLFLLIISIQNVIPLEISEDNCGRVEEVQGDLRTRVPWTAAIYYKKPGNSNYNFLLNGVILGPTTILTVFGGVYGVPIRGARSRYSMPLPEHSLVAVGVRSTSLNVKDGNSQTAEVKYVFPYRGQEPENKLYHFIIYRLKTPLNLSTPYARSICLPSKFKDQDLESILSSNLLQGGFVSDGFGAIIRAETKGNSQQFKYELETANLIRPKKFECSSPFRFHYKTNDSFVLCARKMSGSKSFDEISTKSCLTHGSPLAVQVDNRWYLAGLLVSIPAQKRGHLLTCPPNTLYYFSKIKEHLKWIENNIRCTSNQFPCHSSGKCLPLHAACNQLKDCDDGSDEDPVLCKFQHTCANKYMCGIGGKCVELSQICDGVRDCEDGTDEIFVCKQFDNDFRVQNVSEGSFDNDISHTQLTVLEKNVTCTPPPISEGVLLSCTGPDLADRNCSGAPAKTVARLICENYYRSKYRATEIKMVCGENGLWKPFAPFACEPNCGILSIVTDNNAFVAGGRPSDREQAFPWFSAIFALQGNSFKFICGGSLIEKRVVMTAAHCIFKVFSFQYSVGHLKIVLAPASSSFEMNKLDPISQIYDVTRFWIPPGFNPQTFEGDIALIELHTAVKYGAYIRPVCYLPPLTAENELVGKVAKVAGFGGDQNQDISEVLRYASFDVAGTESCKRGSRGVSLDCRGYLEASGDKILCPGDSGGGVVFPERKRGSGEIRYILKGIVSGTTANDTRPCRAGPNSQLAFTVVESHANWILETLELTQDPL